MSHRAGGADRDRGGQVSHRLFQRRGCRAESGEYGAQPELCPEFAGITEDSPPQDTRGPLAIDGDGLELPGEQEQAGRGLGVEAVFIVGQAPQFRDRTGVPAAEPGAEGFAPRVRIGRAAAAVSRR